MTKVPIEGAWICFFIMAITSFFLDFEEIIKVVNCGNLLTYSFVTACGVALRLRDPQT